MKLSELCVAPDSQLADMTRGELADQCLQFTNIVNPEINTLLLWVSIPTAILTFLAIVAHRSKAGWSAGPMLAEAGEGAVGAAAAAYAGVVAGFFIGMIFPSIAVGVLMVGMAGAVVLFGIIALFRGDAGAGWKFLAVVLFVVLTGIIALQAVASFAVPKGLGVEGAFLRYLVALGVGLGVLSGINGTIASIQRGHFYCTGWVMLPINGSWGFLGNMLGLMMHIASLFCYKDFGRKDTNYERIAYVCYKRGLSLKRNSSGRFAFTQGAVMSADTPDLVHHEGWHVIQHYVFGPIFVLSYFAWTAIMAIVGFIAGLISGVNIGEAVTRYSYYNNPWEVVAYGIANKTGRPTSKDHIWPWGWSWAVSVLYVLLTSASFVVLLHFLLKN